jgi:hypothetical protein
VYLRHKKKARKKAKNNLDREVFGPSLLLPSVKGEVVGICWSLEKEKNWENFSCQARVELL